jgi:hypothetical protein
MNIRRVPPTLSVAISSPDPMKGDEIAAAV